MHQTAKPIFQGDSTLSKYEKELVEKGLVSQAQLEIAKISKENLGLDLGSVLIKKGFVTEVKLLEFIAQKKNIPFISLKDLQIDSEVVHRVPLHIARQHMLIPIAKHENKIRVAMANPFDSFALDDLKDIFRAEIEAYLVSSVEIGKAIEKYFEGGDLEKNASITLEVVSDTGDQSQSETRLMQEMASGPKVINAVNQIIARADMDKASDIHIEPRQHEVLVRYRIDGLLRDKDRLIKSMQLPLISRIKIIGGLDIAERRVPQDGRVRVMLVGKPLDLRISTCPTQYGEKIVIRLLSKDGVRSIEALGFGEKERRLFSDIISKSHGIFLATGPTGSGKSTTLYAALSRINSSEKNIISIEDPIESEVEGVNQVSVNTKTGLTFASVLRSVLRQDPDVIMLGEIRDSETAEIAVRAAITGHMVLSTLHTNSAAGVISRLMDLGVESFLLAGALKGVLAQRLVRKICQGCRMEIPVDRARFGPWADQITNAFNGKGCKDCGFTGFKGRAGIFELAAIDDKTRELIAEGKPDDVIEAAFRENGVKSILQDGLDKVNSGVTTIEEIFRVTQED